MSELIGIREAARRLGVSDTAVHKAIKAGRVQVAGRTEKSDRPLLSWPQAQTDWIGNSDVGRRTHVGSQGSPERAKYAGTEPPEIILPTASSPVEAHQPASEAAQPSAPAPDQSTQAVPAGASMPTGPSYAQSRAVREAYQARLAKLEYEHKSGKLVEVDKVKAAAFRTARTVRDGLLNLPDRVAHELAHETDPTKVHLRLSTEIRTVLEALANPAASIAA